MWAVLKYQVVTPERILDEIIQICVWHILHCICYGAFKKHTFNSYDSLNYVQSSHPVYAKICLQLTLNNLEENHQKYCCSIPKFCRCTIHNNSQHHKITCLGVEWDWVCWHCGHSWAYCSTPWWTLWNSNCEKKPKCSEKTWPGATLFPANPTSIALELKQWEASWAMKQLQ
jgi:hypothetical protein